MKRGANGGVGWEEVVGGPNGSQTETWILKSSVLGEWAQ